MLAGETADLIIGSTQSMEGLALEGKIDPGTRVTFARVGVGVVVPTGSPKVSIGSAPQALGMLRKSVSRRSLLQGPDPGPKLRHLPLAKS